VSAPGRLRVLYVQPAESFGGTERQAATVIPLLAHHGIDALPLVGPGRALGEWLAARGVREVRHCGDFPGGWRSVNGLRTAWRWARCRGRVARAVARIVRERRVDVIYAALPFAWASATPTARRLGVPIVWRSGGPRLAGGAFGYLAFVPWAALGPPDLLVCPSVAAGHRFAKLVPAPLEVVLNGVDPSQFRPGAGDPGLLRSAGDALVVGFAARLVRRKGLLELLAATAIARRERPLRVLVAGTGRDAAHAERAAARLGVADTVTFLGYVDDMPSFYAACDVIALPSHTEGCSNVLLEAMASGCAVVASDIAGNREVVRHGVDGLLVRRGDVAGIGAALIDLARGPALVSRLRGAALVRARHFDAHASAARIAELLHRVADGARMPAIDAALTAPPAA